MTQNTATITVLDALKEHSKSVRITDRDTSTCSSPVDLSVAVLSTSVRYQQRKAEILVGDHSLQRHQCARILFWKLSSVDLDTCKSIQKGDIVRLNSVTIRNDYTPPGQLNAKETNNCVESSLTEKMSTILCDFSHSFNSPPEGASFGIIASMSPMVHGGYYVLINPESGGLCRSLITSHKIISSVCKWYLTEKYRTEVPLSSHPDEHEQRHRPRKVRELSAPNLLSDLLVRSSQQLSVVSINTFGSRFKKHPSQTTFRAVFMDGNGIESESDSIPFHVESSNPLLSRLRQLTSTREIFLIQKVLTIWNDESPTRNEPSRELILVPTSDTCIETKLVAESAVSVASGSNKRLRLMGTNHGEEDPAVGINLSLSESPSSLLGDERSFSLFQNVPVLSNVTKVEDLPPKILRLSCIHYEAKNIFLKADGSWPSCSEIEKILIRKEEGETDTNGAFRYNPAMLTLVGINEEGSHIMNDDSRLSPVDAPELNVKANGDVMRILCCSYDPIQMMTSAAQSSERIQKISDILRGLILLQVPLKWSLVTKRESDKNIAVQVVVKNVSLASLDF